MNINTTYLYIHSHINRMSLPPPRPLVERLISDYARILFWVSALLLLVVVISVVPPQRPRIVGLALASLITIVLMFTFLIVHLIWVHKNEPELCCRERGERDVVLGAGDEKAGHGEEEGTPTKPQRFPLDGRFSLTVRAFVEVDPKEKEREDGAQRTRHEGDRVDVRETNRECVEDVE